MRRPNSLRMYQVFRVSQTPGSDYFSQGFDYFYTQFYTQPNADSMSWFRGKRGRMRGSPSGLGMMSINHPSGERHAPWKIPSTEIPGHSQNTQPCCMRFPGNHLYASARQESSCRSVNPDEARPLAKIGSAKPPILWQRC